MWGDDKNLNVHARLPIEDVVWESRHSIAPNLGRKLDTIALRGLTNLDHCGIKRGEITPTESRLTSLVVGNVLKVFNSRRLSEEITHLSRA